MPKITFIESDGTEHQVDAQNGLSVMQAAFSRSIPGIDAICGGCCTCATCHVYVDEAWVDRVGPREDIEESMLELAENVQASSRLSCQIKITDALDGLVVRVPERQ